MSLYPMHYTCFIGDSNSIKRYTLIKNTIKFSLKFFLSVDKVAVQRM